MTTPKNLFSNIPDQLPAELLEEITTGGTFRIERIVSRGHASPEGFWYDQEESELVFLLQGSAGLRFADKEEIVILHPGDYINIPSHRKHRVEWTDSSQDTVWLAVHYK